MDFCHLTQQMRFSGYPRCFFNHILVSLKKMWSQHLKVNFFFLIQYFLCSHYIKPHQKKLNKCQILSQSNEATPYSTKHTLARSFPAHIMIMLQEEAGRGRATKPAVHAFVPGGPLNIHKLDVLQHILKGSGARSKFVQKCIKPYYQNFRYFFSRFFSFQFFLRNIFLMLSVIHILFFLLHEKKAAVLPTCMVPLGFLAAQFMKKTFLVMGEIGCSLSALL